MPLRGITSTDATVSETKNRSSSDDLIEWNNSRHFQSTHDIASQSDIGSTMLDAIASLFRLSWSQRPQFHPLPPAIKRSFISTPGGDLELLTAISNKPDATAPPIFFVHGGCGHASVWLEWMTYLHNAGYGGNLYSYSARSHGASYAVPYFRMVYRTSLDAMADDLVAYVQAASALENGTDAVLVGHSSGGGLAQYVLSSGRVKCKALCLLGAVPHFGNL